MRPSAATSRAWWKGALRGAWASVYGARGRRTLTSRRRPPVYLSRRCRSGSLRYAFWATPRPWRCQRMTARSCGAAAEIFGGRVPIRVRRCTQLGSTTLEGPVFDLLLEGVPVDWGGMFLPSVDSRVPDRVWEWFVHRNQAAPYAPVGPRDRMVRVPAARQPPTVDPPPATSSAPQPV